MGLFSEKSAGGTQETRVSCSQWQVSSLLWTSVIPTVKRGGRARSGSGSSRDRIRGDGAVKHLLFICTYILEFP